jgi:hypothetical protein
MTIHQISDSMHVRIGLYPKANMYPCFFKKYYLTCIVLSEKKRMQST